MARGVFDDAIEFFRELEEHNTKDWWLDQRHRYDLSIRPVFTAVCAQLPTFGPFRIYRPHNDTRFNGAKEPYKTFVGGVAERPDGVGAFLQVSGRGVLIGTGIPMPAPDQLPRLRQAIAADGSGDEFVSVLSECEQRGVRVHGGRWEPLKRVPAGVPRDHPRADQLRWKGVEANTRIVAPTWASVDEAVAGVDAMMAGADPLHQWLGRHVGPSALSPEERFAPKRSAKGGRGSRARG